MKLIIYFFQFLFVTILFLIFKIIGYKNSSNLGAFIFKKFGAFFRPEKIIKTNLANLNNNIIDGDYKKFINKIWENYGRIFADYISLKNFRNGILEKFITVEGIEILDEIKKNKKPVVFISGHFNNFELMAMIIEKYGVNLSAIYRPLNNIFLNKIMENLRKKYICKFQIPKGVKGSREILKSFNSGKSVAIMIDQRVSEGKEISFFNKLAYTTTIPAQLVKKFNCKVVPVHIQRYDKYYFKIKFYPPIEFSDSLNIKETTLKLNLWLEKMIVKNPDQWIWTHKRWKL